MKLYFMKRQAVDYFKTNIGRLYVNYFQKDDNSWMEEEFGESPFSFIDEIPDFELASLADERSAGEIDLENCKIIYDNLKNFSESQASDERLWAGLCNHTFYKYMRRRYGYTTAVMKDKEKDSSAIMSRFFYASKAKVFSGAVTNVRSGFYRNSLAKCWWVGHATYDKANLINHFEMLDTLGANDLSTKINDIFYSNTFASNPTILRGICDSIKYYNERGRKLRMREELRPTLQYLNAVGGVSLLDALTSDEIRDIMIQRLDELMKGANEDIEVNQDDENDFDDNEDESVMDRSDDGLENNVEDYESSDTNDDKKDDNEQESENQKKPEYLTYGCYYKTYRQKDGKIIERHIPKKDSGDDQLLLIDKKMRGKQVGHKVYLSGSWYELVEFDWEDNYGGS